MLKMHYLHHRFQAMASPCSVHLYADTDTHALEIAQQCETEVRRLEQKYSRYRDDSVTAAIHQAARNKKSFTLDSETAALLHYAHTAWEQSDGLFDITSGILRYAWDFRSGRLPSQKQIDELLPRIGWDKVHIHQNELRFSRTDMEIDFGGYVKEYAADCVAAIALQQGIRHGLVELGGDIRVIGPHPDGRPWSIGIRHPRQPGAVLATIALSQGALASSGDYERCMIIAGIHYGHILNPKTGWPVQGLMAVSVVADHCLLAGTATTLALLKGDDGHDWLRELDQPWLAMSRSGHIYGSLAS